MSGNWFTDKNNLPGFEYTGKIPYAAKLSNGKDIKLPEDPWFLMGNYQMTIFAHVSGEYELITGQRSWGRMNFGDRPNSGVNSCTIHVKSADCDKDYSLCGMDSVATNETLCRRRFGIGYAEYSYDLKDLFVKRQLFIKPSTKISNGESAFVLQLSFTNTSSSALELSFAEKILARYQEIQYQTLPESAQKIQFKYYPIDDEKQNYIGYRIEGSSADPLLINDRNKMSMYEAFPPSLFMAKITDSIQLKAENRQLLATQKISMEPGETKSLQLIIGFFNEELPLSKVREGLKTNTKDFDPEYGFQKLWKNQLPLFEKETDEELRQELIWHAYNIESMATYSQYYKETKIPQGTIYDYYWGKHASARDNLQHALPCVYYNPELAKSTIRYLLKRTTSFGEVKLIEYGNGYAEHEGYFTSDQQLFLFLLVSEFLRVTGDYAFLQEKVEAFPYDGSGVPQTVLCRLEQCFTFLRDTIGVGEHGLVRLYNSDWNDTIFYIEKEPYNIVVRKGESHMNSAMVCSIFQELIGQMEKGGACKEFVQSMKVYRKSIFDAYIRDTGDRPFPRRMYFANKAYGEENMFLEPMGYTLQMDDFPLERKKLLYKEMLLRLYEGEKLGARQQQVPQFESPDYDKGSRENGGFWWALNGPVINGVATWDKEEAKRLLNQMTLKNYAKQFPDYWCGLWDASDNHESSLIPEEGLSDQSFDYSLIPHCCAHAHAWILYCYWKISE